MDRRSLLLVAALAAVAAPLSIARADRSPVGPPAPTGQECVAPSYTTRTLGAAPQALPARPILRFVNLSDSHILDDEASPVITGNAVDPVLDPAMSNGSGQRLQEEFTDEVLDAMVETINRCHQRDPLSLMVATGDLTDNMTLNELRRYVDNLDGVAGAPTAYEAHCGYTTHDSNGRPKLGAGPCTPELQQLFAVPTGRLVADAQAPTPDPSDPSYQFSPSRTARQLAETFAASAPNGSHNLAPGLPPSLRCTAGQPRCRNHRLAIPHFAVFGNHDGAVRGTVTFEQPFQAGAAAVGRYFFESQREVINEFFYTATEPKGHGFGFAGPRLADADDRNDGWYAFDAGPARMIVLNTILDGVREELHRNGQTNTDTGGLVDGSEVRDPSGLEKGGMSDAQLRWLDAELAASDAAGRPALVFSHHPARSFADAAVAGRLNAVLGAHRSAVAHIAGHTHENVIGAHTATPHRFWQVETASLIDYPQEGRIVELYDLGGGRYGLRLTMIQPERAKGGSARASYELSVAEATCTTSAMMGGNLSGGFDPATFVTNAGEAAVRQKFCFGEASLAAAAGGPEDRDVILLP